MTRKIYFEELRGSLGRTAAVMGGNAKPVVDKARVLRLLRAVGSSTARPVGLRRGRPGRPGRAGVHWSGPQA